MQVLLIVSTLFLFNEQVVEAADVWHSYKFDTGYDNRQELVILEAVSEIDFHVGKDVFQWKSIYSGGLNYAVGLMPRGITVLTSQYNQSENRFVSNHTVIDLKNKPTDVTLLERWNRKKRKSDVIAVVATSAGQNGFLEWFKICPNRAVEQFWTWSLPNKVVHVRYFKHERHYKLLLVNEGMENNTSADLYEFKVQDSSKNFWLVQHIPLVNPTNSSAISNFGSDYFLSIPQKSLNLVLIYKYTNSHFVFYKNITCNAADNVIAFTIGFKSFLAIAGINGAIFQFNRTSLNRLEVAGSHLEGVRYWYEVPVKNFRDEVILLAQREVNHESHVSHALEIIMHNDNTFVLHEEFTCVFHGETASGLRCVADEEREEGIVGLTTLMDGQTIGLLVPRKEAPSGLLMLKTAMKKLPSTAEVEMQKIAEARKKLEKMIKERRHTFLEENHTLDNSENSNKSNFSEKTEKARPSAAYKSNPRSRAEHTEAQFVVLEQELQDMEEELLRMQKLLDHVLQQKPNENKQFKTLVLNGIVEIQNGGNFRTVTVEKINGDSASGVLADIVRRDSVENIVAPKTFTDIKIENLQFKTINGIPSDNIAFDGPDGVTLKGDVIFKETVDVLGNLTIHSGKVNDIVLEDEIIIADKKYNGTLNFESVQFEKGINTDFINNMPIHSRYLDGLTPKTDLSNIQNLQLDTLYIPVHVTAGNVNGENFTEFLNNLVMINVDTYFRGHLDIIGGIKVIGDVNIQYLNKLKFPDEYVLREPRDYITISGKKRFNNTVYADEVTTRGKLNNIDPQTIITLSKNQTILGTLTFNSLEVTESLDVDGDKIVQPDAIKILPNPTVLDSKIIHSNVIFENVQVDGLVILSENFNGSNFASIMGDALYKDEELQSIDSIKEFPNGLTIRNDLKVSSKSINDIPLAAFVTKDTEQVFRHPLLLGSATFERLYLKGLYDGINIKKLDQETVKISGDQFLSSTLIFEDTVTMNVLNITEKLNKIDVDEYLFTNSDFVIGNITFLKMSVEKLHVEGNAQLGIRHFDLDDFDKRRLSATRNQTITAGYYVKNLHANTMIAVYVNDIPYKELFNVEDYLKNLAPLIYSGNIRIKNLHINGSLQIDEINGFDVETVLSAGVWNRKLRTPGINLIITNMSMFGHLQTEKFNGVDFDSFSKNLVYKHETNIEFEGYKHYLNGIDVVERLECQELNTIPLENILRKTGTQKVKGPLEIRGNVFVNSNTDISETLNNIPIEDLKNMFETIDGGYKINGDVYFSRLTRIQSFNTTYADGVHVSSHLDEILFKNRDVDLFGNTVFYNTVTIKGNMAVGTTLNGIHLSDFLSNAVLTTRDSEIESVVEFEHNVLLLDVLEVAGDLSTRYLSGVDLEYWVNNAMYTNRGILEGTFTLQNASIKNSLHTDFINDIDVNSLIPLKTNQTIEGTMEFHQMSSNNNISVGSFVNGYNLTNEFDNTVMSNLDQDILSDVIFEDEVVVEGNLTTAGLVNGIPLTKLVTTNTDQTLSGDYRFIGDVAVEAEASVNGTIAGVNITKWSQESVKQTNEHPQELDGHWSIHGNLTFSGDVESTGLLKDLDIRKTAEELERKRNNKNKMQKKIAEDYRNMCEDVNYVMRKAKKQIYAFEYFEKLQDLSFNTQVKSVLHFQHEENHYLLVSEENNCLSHLLQWKYAQYYHVATVETGIVAQIIGIPGTDAPTFVTRSGVLRSGCVIEGVNLWRFDRETLQYVLRLTDLLLLQESLIPETFYGIDSNGVVEYKVTHPDISVITYRTWHIPEGNLTFVPRGIGTGLAVRNGARLYHLIRNEPPHFDNFEHDIPPTIVGRVIRREILPGYHTEEILPMRVGAPDSTRVLVAVATREESTVEKGVDLIKIYDDVLAEKLFQNIPTHKPSSLVSIEFGNGETLLVLFEDKTTLQVYEYKGIEGLKHRTSAKIEGSKLFVGNLPTVPNKPNTAILGVVHQNEIKFFEAVMSGNQLREKELNCELYV